MPDELPRRMFAYARVGVYPVSHTQRQVRKGSRRTDARNGPPMATPAYFPRRIILAGAMMCGVLLALAVHVLGQRFNLDLGGLWRFEDPRNLVPAGAALAWWLIASVAFCGGYFTASLMHRAVSGRIPRRMRQFLVVTGVLVLAAAGQAASAPSAVPTATGVIAGLMALCLGAAMAFCGAHFALRKP